MNPEKIDSGVISCQYIVLIFFQRRQVINCIDKILMVLLLCKFPLLSCISVKFPVISVYYLVLYATFYTI